MTESEFNELPQDVKDLYYEVEEFVGDLACKGEMTINTHCGYYEGLVTVLNGIDETSPFKRNE